MGSSRGCALISKPREPAGSPGKRRHASTQKSREAKPPNGEHDKKDMTRPARKVSSVRYASSMTERTQCAPRGGAASLSARATRRLASVMHRRANKLDGLMERKLLADMRGYVSGQRFGIRSSASPGKNAHRDPLRPSSLTPTPAPHRSGPDAVPLGEAKKNARGGGEDVLSSMARRLVRFVPRCHPLRSVVPPTNGKTHPPPPPASPRR